MRENEFGLDDFRKQLVAFSRPGLVQRMLDLMPGRDEMMRDERAAAGVRMMIGIIDSMTQQERRNPKIIEDRRLHRIARGAGVQVSDVNQLVRQFESIKPIILKMRREKRGWWERFL